MKKSTFLIFSGYIWTKTLLGLTFHPFMTIKQVVRRPVLLPVIFSPIIGLAAFFVFGPCSPACNFFPDYRTGSFFRIRKNRSIFGDILWIKQNRRRNIFEHFSHINSFLAGVTDISFDKFLNCNLEEIMHES